MQLRLATQAMGTRFELVLEGRDAAQLRAAGEEALAELEETDRQLSLFRRDSLLSHINRCAADSPVRLDLDTHGLLSLCDGVCRSTNGAFDPTVAPLMRAYGLHGEDSQVAATNVASAAARVGWRGAVRIHRDPPRVSLTGSGTALDLGGVAKGHGLDLAARCLREAGVRRALLHGGTSTIVAIGRPRNQDGWRVAIGPGADAPQAVLADEALAVSAPSGRTSVYAGREVSHVMDPRRGTPVDEVTVAAVLAPSAASADAWSTATLVGGRSLHFPAHLEVLLATGGTQCPDWHLHSARESRFKRIPTPIHCA